jgi:hypothetical protein
MDSDPDTAQARVFVCALRDQVRELSTRLAKAERPDGLLNTSRARVMRKLAADLRRDLGQAQFLIDRLHRRYPALAAEPDDGLSATMTATVANRTSSTG